MDQWRNCSKEGCERPELVRGFCQTHYVAARRAGLPTLKRPTDQERLDAGTLKGGPDDCWEWQRATDTFGYGTISVDGRDGKAHRLAWTLAYGSVPEGLCVLHACDNPPCCNPAHLWLGDRKANNDDKEAKGRARHPRGEHHGSAILTAAQVNEIRAAYAQGDVTQRTLAARYGVSPQSISGIICGVSWQATGSTPAPPTQNTAGNARPGAPGV